MVALFNTADHCIFILLHGRFVLVGKTLTDLQMLGRELHQNAFGGRALPGPARGAAALPQTPQPLLVSKTATDDAIDFDSFDTKQHFKIQ